MSIRGHGRSWAASDLEHRDPGELAVWVRGEVTRLNAELDALLAEAERLGMPRVRLAKLAGLSERQVQRRVQKAREGGVYGKRLPGWC